MRLFGRGAKKRESKERRIFGFPCDPGLQLMVRATAASLQVPIYPLAEHLLQLGLYHALPALKDKALGKSLQDHLVARHLLQKDLEDEIDGYDGRLMSEIQKQREREMARLAEALALIGLYETQGVSPEDVLQVMESLANNGREEKNQP